MNRHLSTQDIVDALEGTLAADRQRHLGSCDACGREVAGLRDLPADVRAGGAVPEPSPLFWEHLGRRVREATAREPIAAPRWWESAWRPLVALGAVAGAVAIVALVVPQDAGPAPDAPRTAAAGPEPGSAAASAIDDDSLRVLSEMAAGLSEEDLQQARPTRDATAAVIEDLTPAQQAEFVRLIKAEMGNPE